MVGPQSLSNVNGKKKCENDSTVRRLHYKVPEEGLKPIAEGIFNSHLRYGIILTVKPRLSIQEESNTSLKKLQTLQNDVQRIILGIKREDRVRNEDLWARTKMQTVNHGMLSQSHGNV